MVWEIIHTLPILSIQTTLYLKNAEVYYAEDEDTGTYE